MSTCRKQATFTSDLLNSVYGEYKDVYCEVIALNDPSETCNYPEEVVFQIERDKIEDYYHAADYINQSNADIVCLQHEFCLFWEEADDYLFALLSGINKPVYLSNLFEYGEWCLNIIPSK